MSKSKVIRSVMCTAVAFLLSLFIVLLTVLTGVKATVLNPKYAEKILVKSNYAAILQTKLKEEFVSYGNAANVDESFFEEFFKSYLTNEIVLKDTKVVFNSFYEGNPIDVVNTAELEKKLTEELLKYAEKKNLSLNDEAKSSIADFSRQLCELYNSYVNIFGLSYFKTAGSILARYTPYVTYAIIGCAALCLVSMFIIRMAFKKRKNAYRFFIYSFSSAALMVLVLPVAILISNVAGKINIALPSLFEFAKLFINQTLYAFVFSAIILAVITAILAGIRLVFVKKKM